MSISLLFFQVLKWGYFASLFLSYQPQLQMQDQKLNLAVVIIISTYESLV